MVYFAPYIDASGLHIPNYNAIRDRLVEEFKKIYGQDIYLENDSQDYQMISAFALLQYDTMQLLQIIYNNRSPKTAVGTALDSIVKLNGLKRKSASYSTCVVELTGDIGAIITNGIVQDDSGNNWNLPPVVTITNNPYSLTVICNTLGAIEAIPGTITRIVTPTKGWLSVVNNVPAIAGDPIETDLELRARQSISVAAPSQTLMDSLISGLADIAGVNRFKIYENDSSLTNSLGIPSHSVAAVVEGGLDADIAKAIYLLKGIGTGTYGNTLVSHADAEGFVNAIYFSRPSYVPIEVNVTIKTRPGYISATHNMIIEQITIYINELTIGANVTITGIYASILTLITNLSKPTFSPVSLSISRGAQPLGTTDITMAYNEIASVKTITITEV